MKRILGIVALLLVVAVVAAVLWLARSLDGMVENAVENVGSELLGTRVSVGSVDIDPVQGRGTIRNLSVRNPEGFSSDDAFSLGEVVLGIDLASLTGTPIVLTEVSVRDPDVLAEASARGMNLDVLRRHVAEASAAEASQEVPADAGEPPRIRIARLAIEGSKARSDTTALGGSKDEIEIPALSMNDVGGSAGATPGELGKTVLETWLRRIAGAAARHQAGQAAGEALEKGKEKLGEALEGLLN